MTEIPEHLLARSRARREAAGLATPADAGAAPAPAAGTDVEPAAAAAATPAPAAAPPPPPPPKPDPPYIQAYKNRKKIPFWAVPALVVLPLWAYIYANTLETPPAATAGPLAEGKTIYGQCASCHGAAGEGGVGPSFQNGELSKSWPKFADQIRWVSLGSNGWPGSTYGAQNKPKAGGMPTWSIEAGGSLTPLQIALVVRYEREVLGGLPPEPDLVAITEGTAPPLDKDGNPAPAGT
jgi:mono/diheme cytochrome c family protein